MPITRNLRKTILSRAKEDADSRRHMLAEAVHRMLGPSGNPRAENILEIIKIL